MNLKQGFDAVLIGAAVLYLGLSLAAQGAEKYKTRLSPVPLDTSQLDTIKGGGLVTAELVGNKVTITGTFSGMTSPATIAQLHQGPNMGMRGKVVAELTVTKAPAGSISGSIELTPTQAPMFKKGNFYVQIHSEKAPEGNLWGWLVLEPRK